MSTALSITGEQTDIKDLICEWVQERIDAGESESDAGTAVLRRLMAEGLADPFLDRFGPGMVAQVWHRYSVAPARRLGWLPPKLVEPLIKAGTSERGQCPECGAPWARVTEVERVKHPNTPGKGGRQTYATPQGGLSQSSAFRTGLVPVSTTTGWRATCAHDLAPVPCTVLDPFGGSGTVAQVADRLGRDAILCELNPEYGEQAVRRVTSETPMFTEMEVA